MRKMVLAFVGVILLIVIGGSLVYSYEFADVKVRVKRQVRCSGLYHNGDTLLEETNREMVMPRWRARSLGVQQETKTCLACRLAEEKIRQEAEAQATEVERQAKAKAEAEKLTQDLEIRFCLVHPGGVPGWEAIPTTGKFYPSDRVMFIFYFKNNRQKPIPDGTLRAIVRPVGSLIFGHGESLFSWDHIVAPHVDNRRWLKVLSGKGFAVPRIVPYNSPYFQGNNTVYDLEIMELHYLSADAPPGEYLAISPEAKPGQSIQFTGYVSINGHEILIGTVNCDVMYK